MVDVAIELALAAFSGPEPVAPAPTRLRSAQRPIWRCCAITSRRTGTMNGILSTLLRPDFRRRPSPGATTSAAARLRGASSHWRYAALDELLSSRETFVLFGRLRG